MNPLALLTLTHGLSEMVFVNQSLLTAIMSSEWLIVIVLSALVIWALSSIAVVVLLRCIRTELAIIRSVAVEAHWNRVAPRPSESTTDPGWVAPGRPFELEAGEEEAIQAAEHGNVCPPVFEQSPE